MSRHLPALRFGRWIRADLAHRFSILALMARGRPQCVRFFLLSVLLPLLIGAGLTFAMSGSTPAEFLIARISFALAAIDICGLVIWWFYKIDFVAWKYVLGALIFAGRLLLNSLEMDRLEAGNSHQNNSYTFLEESAFKVELIDGKMKVSIKITDESGNMVAELIRNEWKIDPTRSWDGNYSDDALEVKDHTGLIILQVRAVADVMQIQGAWWTKYPKK